ncbi:MAG TPA: hypothetical protein VIY08_15815 [Candidatus Nitrosocosmicus sp.]
MNTSNESSTETDSASQEYREQNNKIKNNNNQNQSIKTPESKFYELIQWLQQWGYKVEDKTKENKVKEIKLKAQITPILQYSIGVSTPVFLELQTGLDDGFFIRSTFELDKNIELHLKNQKREREIELTYLQIEQIILPLRISILKDHPRLYIYKIIFIEDLTKQAFFDYIHDLINAMSLIIGKWDEKYYEIRPKANNEEQSRK